MKQHFSKATFPQVIAHRGLSSKAPENTLAAISLSADEGMSWVEVDVKLTLDGIFVLCHDETVDRTTNGTGKVSTLSSCEVFSLDAGSWFSKRFCNEKIPELEKVLALCKQRQLGINLELKPDTGNLAKFAHKLAPIIKNYQQQGVDILVSSFNKAVILEIRKLNSELAIGFLVDENDNYNSINKFINQTNCISFHLPDKRCNKDNLSLLKPFAKLIFVYTVNNLTRSKELFDLGVDAVFSDINLSN